MKTVITLLLLAFAATGYGASLTAEQAVIDHLQRVSLTVKGKSGEGSGNLFTRQDGKDTVSYVWTAGHVIDGSRITRNQIVAGNKKTIIEFYDVQVIQEFQQDGRRVGETKVEAEVIAYSDAEVGEDLALLRIRRKNFAPVSASVEFYKGDIPQPGTDLLHVGSLLGQFGANSLTKGSVSHIGRVLELRPGGVVFDQVNVQAMPGSSGGGVFTEDGRYMGMLVRGASQGFNFIVPIRRMEGWAKRVGVEWALDHNKPVTEVKQLDDSGVTDVLDYLRTKDSLKYPYMIHREAPNGLDFEPAIPRRRVPVRDAA